MFKLQRLEITGFKSFADHTELIFTGDGITAIVGPNGCGKSNVADAIAWVLGEQRVKHLRGAEMKDVIFQGSRNRQPGGMAEVVLHLVRDEAMGEDDEIDVIDSTLEEIDEHSVILSSTDDQEKTDVLPESVRASSESANESADRAGSDVALSLPNAAAPESVVETAGPSESHTGRTKTHYRRHWRPHRLALGFAPGEAVSVTRRLYRSGESEYLLNGRACRLRDIQDLFSGTGLSGAHYAIIEQGRIGQILSAKPMDRRTLIEEAAGITKFRVRQRAAEARLESARGNLARISDIISEIERQVGSLRRQAAKARRYRALREELRDLLRRVYVVEDRTLSAVIEETTREIETGESAEGSLVDALESVEAAARDATQQARVFEDALAEARQAAAEAVLQRDRQLREQSYREEQTVALGQKEAEIASDLESLRVRLAETERELDRLRRQDASERISAEESALALSAGEAGYARKLQVAANAESEIELARAELLTHTAVTERFLEIARQLESALDRLGSQAEGLEREGERAAAVHAEREAEAATLAIDITRARERLARLHEEREVAVRNVVGGHEMVAELDSDFESAREEFSRVRNRLDTLSELDSRRAYYSAAVQRLFSLEDAADRFHFIGTLADVLNVAPQWERAVEGALGSALQAILVPTPDDALRAASWLRANDAGRANFIVMGLHGASDETEVASGQERAAGQIDPETGILRDVQLGSLLGATPELAAVMARTMPQRMAARICSSLDDALAKSLATGDMYVTADGDWVSGGQMLVAGDERALEEGAGLLGFKREMRDLERHARGLGERMAAAREAAGQARARLTDLEDVVVSLNEVIGREERDAMARELAATGLAQEIERAVRHLRVVNDDTARLAEELAEVEHRLQAARADASAADAARLAAADAVALAMTRLATARQEAEAENAGLSEQRAVAAAFAERRRSTAAELRRRDAERDELLDLIQRREAELREVTLRLEEMQSAISGMSDGARSIEQHIALHERRITEAAAELAEARESADNLAAELAELNRRAASMRNARAELEVRNAEAVARRNYVHEACLSDLNQSLSDLSRDAPVPDDVDLDFERARIDELRARIEGFGAINMMALEELAENEERLAFLTGQRKDIIDGIAATEEALREIKHRSRERFRDAFERINVNFGALFQQLFGGGRGEMSLIDADDVLESGIDIVAQPPGKRLQNVLLLSGGEKAMAALALVLGIFQYRPSPFCLLDEVDAPLDEANIGRFTNKIIEMASTSQFIVVTHNKRTMEMARALYGVTMEEAGVSRLVSVRFE